ncbi:MAG: hypothetical protein WDN10_02245 [bacterium]
MYGSDGKDYKLFFYNCPKSKACYGATIIKSLADPTRPATACAVYSSGGSMF